MMNFYCSEKHDKTNWFDSEADWGTVQNKVEHNKGKTTEQHQTHGEGHADHEEAQAGDQAAAVEDQRE